jgi:ParB-like chromosome segregation protein Spo0J
MSESTHRTEIGRYDRLPNVRIDEARVPAPLRELLPFARAWGICGEDALERAIRRASREQMLQVVHAARPVKAVLHDFAYESAGASATPVPDEVVLFQMFAWSLQHLEVEVRQ